MVVAVVVGALLMVGTVTRGMEMSVVLRAIGVAVGVLVEVNVVSSQSLWSPSSTGVVDFPVLMFPNRLLLRR